MRAYTSTQPLYNPLFPPINPRFAVHPAGFNRSATGPDDVGRHNLNPPAYPAPGYHPLACHLTPVKGYLSPTQLHRKLLYLRNPSTPGRAAA